MRAKISTSSGRKNVPESILNNTAGLSTLGGSGGRGNRRFQLLLAQTEKEWQRERHSHGEHRQNDQPAMPDADTLAFDARERDQHHGRDQYVHAKKRPD